MKKEALLIIVVAILSTVTISAQTKKDLERQKNKVNYYSSEETDNLQIWFSEQVDQMKLTEDERTEYYSIVLYHTVKMARLDDKDKNLTEEEQKSEFKVLMDKLNKEAKKMLTNEQYKIHEKSIQELANSAYAKRGWKFKKEK
ncbi:hypothetical protein ABN763_16665 [Spongiivirga sp. MCCC 1A20706]|uniref:hypothetical protein n=1 Tax=Spongiivirga sp. MCCC 1A20706 TaxID=3160963 RepID=UPI0039778B2C